MKSPRLFKLHMLAALVLAGLSVCRADIVYQDSFTRVGALNGSAPAMDNTGNSVTWSGHANYTTDGTNCVIPAQGNWQWPTIGLPIDMGYFWDTTLSCDVKLDNASTGDWVGISYGDIGNYWATHLILQISGNGAVNAYCGATWDAGRLQLVTNAMVGIPGGWNTIAIQYSNYNATASIIVNGTYLAQDVAVPISVAPGVNLLQFNDGGAKIANFKVETPSAEVVKPSIADQPLSRRVFVGDPVTLTVRASGTLPLSYRWRKNGSDIPGAESVTFSLPATALTDAANYTVVVTNSGGAVTSEVATVTAYLENDLILAADDFDSYVPGSYAYAYFYSSTNVPLTSAWSYQTNGGVGDSGAGLVSGDTTGFIDVQVDWAGLAGVVHLPPQAPTKTAYLPAYRCSLDARVENLVPDIKSNTACRMTVSFQANAGTNFTALSAVRAINVTSNYQHFSFTLDTADYGGASALTFFENNLGYVNGIEFSISADGIANDFVRGPGNHIVLDNLKLEQRTSPLIRVTQNPSGQPVVEWVDSATTLQSATNAVGPYTDVTGAASPYSVPAGKERQFFRTRW